MFQVAAAGPPSNPTTPSSNLDLLADFDSLSVGRKRWLVSEASIHKVSTTSKSKRPINAVNILSVIDL